MRKKTGALRDGEGHEGESYPGRKKLSYGEMKRQHLAAKRKKEHPPRDSKNGKGQGVPKTTSIREKLHRSNRKNAQGHQGAKKH